jgi:membrane protease YdiL (CAAX protease family)
MDAGTVTLFQRLLKDRQFRAALGVALFFWGGLYVLAQPDIDLLWPLAAPVAFLLPVLVYPVLEEIVFRGAAQGMLWQTRVAGIMVGLLSGPNLLVSVLFAGLHIYLQSNWLAISVFIPSLIFGYFRDRYKHIAPSIVLHVFYNAGLFLIFKTPG